MFYEQRMAVPGSPADLHAEYLDDLRTAVESVGTSRALEETDVESDRLETLLDGGSPELTLTEAAQLQSLSEGEPDTETIVEMAGEHLLLGMTTAVLDVDGVASELALDLDPTEIQQKIERRSPMRFEEFVHVQYVIASESP